MAHRRVPVLRRRRRSTGGVLGRALRDVARQARHPRRRPGCPNLYLVNGSSGHGVMHAPALGQLLAEIICDGEATTLDVRALRPARFAEGEPNPVSGLAVARGGEGSCPERSERSVRS